MGKLLKTFISNELYNYFNDYINTVYLNHKKINKLHNILLNIYKVRYSDDIIKTYMEHGVKQIEFDIKWNLLGFNNGVYDLQNKVFRDYKIDDYISITTGYDWREPTTQEINILENIIEKIMPHQDIRQLYLEILSTTMEGRCLDKFIVFNGGGDNRTSGKELIDELLVIALGNYATMPNSSILFQKSVASLNRTKSYLQKKRFVLYSGQPIIKKINNYIVKELTNYRTFSYRNYNSIILNSTSIYECNKQTSFAEKPTDADIRRLINIYFPSTFTDNYNEIDETNYIYQAHAEYKSPEFKNKYKFALLKILMNAHINYADRNFKFDITQSILDKTNEYLETNCELILWFKENYELVNTNNKQIYVTIKNIFEYCTSSAFFDNLNIIEQNEMTYEYFLDLFYKNIVTRKYFTKYVYFQNKNQIIQENDVLLFWKYKT